MKFALPVEVELSTHCSRALVATCNVHVATFHNFRIAVAVAASSRVSFRSPSPAT